MFNFLRKSNNFDSAVQVVLRHEGGLTNNPSDPGGITDYGISLRFLRAAGIDGNMNRSNHVTEDDIKALTPEKAEKIYYKYFWQKFNIDKIYSPILSTSIFDMSVLMGGQEAIKQLQKALNIENVDGILGPKTLSIANKSNSYQLNSSFKAQCRLFFLELTTKNTKLKVFYDGWINRVNSL